MVIRKYIGDENPNIYDNSLCSAELTGGLQNQLRSISALNTFLSITAVLGNTLILAALHNESSLHPPSKLLLRSLAVTDLCVGLIVQPLAVIDWMSTVNEQWNICRFPRDIGFITGYILCSVSLLTITAISVDRLLALLLGLRYRQIVTLKRTYAVIIVFWVVSIVGTMLSFWKNLVLLLYLYTGTSLCFVTSAYSYTKIFYTLHHRQHQVQTLNSVLRRPNQAIPLNITRYRKAVYGALWVQLALVVCYLPYNVTMALTNSSTPTKAIYLARQVTRTFLYLNSSLNPILYCWKIREVRHAVKEKIRHIFCLSS